MKDLLAVMEDLLDHEFKATREEPLFQGGTGIDSLTWNETCRMWKETYPVVLPRHYSQDEHKEVNIYAFIKELSSRLPENRITVVGNGSACVVGGHAYVIKTGPALYFQFCCGLHGI